MSVGVCGKIYFNDTRNIVDISYYIQRLAIENKIGCKLGGNVCENVFNMYGNFTGNCLYFELMDTPIDNYAEELFVPTISEDNNYEETFKSKIYNTMDIIVRFLREILILKEVENIDLDINYLFRDDRMYNEVSIDVLKDYIYEQYVKEDFFVPSIGIKVSA